MTDPVEGNRMLWDAWTTLHLQAPGYDFAGVRAGRSTLRPIELREFVPAINGERVLHLQCHVGLDTLSLARAGAQVTGIDFSPAAIAVAQALATELGVPARFVVGDVVAAPVLAGQDFAFVFASYGVLSWLPDLPAWAEAIRACLRRGGAFYMVERHPILRVTSPRTVDDAGRPIALAYFGTGEPVPVTECGSYAARAAESRVAHYWPHTLGEVVTALAGAGLRLRYLHEHPEVALTTDASGTGGPGLFSVWADRVDRGRSPTSLSP